MERLQQRSAWPGWRSTVLWTVLGPLGCMAITSAYTAAAFRDFDADAIERAMTGAVLLPLLLGTPLFLYFSLKLRELALANRKLGVVAATDGLTECLNRNAFTTLVATRLTHVGHGALLIIDADHFKRINDRFGHQNGDRALTLIAEAIRGSVRSGDVVGRLGGEEFGVFLPGVNRTAAEAVAERLRRGVEDTSFVADGLRYPLSVSVGGVVFDGCPQFDDLFQEADKRLYSAKQAGRNRVAMTGYWQSSAGLAAQAG